MTTYRIGSNWLDDPSDEQFVKKGSGSLGRHLLKQYGTMPIGEQIEKMLTAKVRCPRGHETTVGQAGDSMLCVLKSCREPLGLVDAPEPIAKSREQEREQTGEYTGGMLDGVPLRSNPNKPRRPIVR
jgi:hypothetical protein